MSRRVLLSYDLLDVDVLLALAPLSAGAASSLAILLRTAMGLAFSLVLVLPTPVMHSPIDCRKTRAHRAAEPQLGWGIHGLRRYFRFFG